MKASWPESSWALNGRIGDEAEMMLLISVGQIAGGFQEQMILVNERTSSQK